MMLSLNPSLHLTTTLMLGMAFTLARTLALTVTVLQERDSAHRKLKNMDTAGDTLRKAGCLSLCLP